jgi:hypothetical protein
VPADAPFFLGHTAAVNDAAAGGPRSGDDANFRHGAGMGAQKVPRAGRLSSDLLAKAFGVVERKFHIKVKVYSRNR